MDKPNEIDLIEKFIKLEHARGVDPQDLIDRMMTAFQWFIENRVQKRITNELEKLALPKVLEISKAAIAEEIQETISN
jgi:hypothetical protein